MGNLNAKKDGVNSDYCWIVLQSQDEVIKIRAPLPNRKYIIGEGYNVHENYWDARAELIKRQHGRKK